MKKYIRIKINTSKISELLLKLHKINVNIDNISYHKDYLTGDILSDDLKKIKKYLFSYKVELIEEIGLFKVKNLIFKNALFLTALLFGMLIFLLLNNLTVKVNVIHEDASLRELIMTDLQKYGVVPLSFKKTYQEYEDIITKIKEAHKDKIEWLEIDVVGMNVNIRVEERIIKDYPTTSGTCHIVAKKEGVITSIYTKRGVSAVTINDYVKKGDILISGEIKLNEEVKNDVCAEGKVLAEVWYDIKTTFPLKYEETTRTGKKRFNLMLKKNREKTILLKSRVQEKEVEDKLLFKIFGFEVYLEKEYEVKKEVKTYSLDAGIKKAQALILEKIKIVDTKIERIIAQKVLQKSVNNDNLDMEVFLVVEEDIGLIKTYTKVKDSDTSDSKNNGDNKLRD